MKQFKSNQKFGQVISKEEIENWNSNVIFEGGTATGKTYFVVNNLKEHCIEHGKRVLFLCNRLQLSSEVKKDVLDAHAKDIIRVETYQGLENRIKNNIALFDLEGFDYIVCDEFHYMTSDSSFNVFTDLSYDWIMEQKALRIFMSATCEGLFNIFLNKGYVHPDNHYYIPKDYSYVEKITFYSKRNDADAIIENIMNNSDDKIIYFCQSMDKLIELYEKYEDNATFFCSKWTKNERAKEILKANKGKIHKKTFKGRILFASQALDVGVTLKDYDIKHIIVDIFNHETLQQCLGRKRVIDEVDTCQFYIRTYTKRELNMFRKTRILDEMKMFKNDREQFNKEYLVGRKLDNPYIYYDFVEKDFKMNKLAFYDILQSEYNLYEMSEMVVHNAYGQEFSGIGYQNFILQKLNCPEVPVEYYDVVKEEVNIMNLTEYLDSIVGKKLFKDEQQELKDEFVKDGLKARTLGINTLNGNLIDRKMPYLIESDRDFDRKDENGNKNLNYSKTYWIIAKKVYQ